MYTNLIFDLDDTLCHCSIFYDKQCEEFSKFQSNRTGLSAEFCAEFQRKLDVHFTSLPGAFNKDRYPRSFAAASLALDTMMGMPPDHDAAQISSHIGYSVFHADYPLIDGTMDMLHQYQSNGFQLFLFTKGDPHVQSRKIQINNLNKIFHTNKIYIVDKKDPSHLEQIIADHNIPLDDCVVIGDSLRDEIRCAHELGIPSIWVESDTSKWAYENQIHPYTYSIDSIIKLPTIIEMGSLSEKT